MLTNGHIYVGRRLNEIYSLVGAGDYALYIFVSEFKPTCFITYNNYRF